MGGLCIGSTFFPRMRILKGHPLRTYAFIELSIAALAVIVQFAMPVINQVYFAGAASGLPGMLLRGVVAAVCMLPPTILMGASLPAIVRWLEASPRAVAWWGWLYGGNTAGAVIGCLLAGFWLLRDFNTLTGTLFAAALNVVVALVSLALSASTPDTIPISGPAPGAEAAPEQPADLAIAAPPSQSNWPVYVTIATLRRRRPGCGGRLDPPARLSAPGHGLRFRHYSGRFPHRPRARHRRRLLAAPQGQRPQRARLVPDPADPGLCMDRLHHRQHLQPAFLERRSPHHPRWLAHVCPRSQSRRHRHLPRHPVLGRKFPARLRGRSSKPGQDSGKNRRRQSTPPIHSEASSAR